MSGIKSDDELPNYHYMFKRSLRNCSNYILLFHPRFIVLTLIGIGLAITSVGQRVPVLSQIKLPHDYYYRELYLPQMTSGPSSVAWTPDGKSLIYSMSGSLWIQYLNSDVTTQLTNGEGYDYQPDCSPDGKTIVFTRYNGSSVELLVLDLATGKTASLTQNNAVNLEPRWSSNGRQLAFVSTMNTGHFIIYTADYQDNRLTNLKYLLKDRKSTVKRYYYSSFDHSINPVWSKDGKEILFISNREIAHGTGDLVSVRPGLDTIPITIHHEETSWKTKPDISPDGTRIVYSSYLGRNWHQLWLLPVEGGYPVPLTYGDFDNTNPRWSPDASQIAFISNRTGNTSLWLVDPLTGAQKQVTYTKRHYLNAMSELTIITRNESGEIIPSRISITDSKQKFYAPNDAWIKADDSVYPEVMKYEHHYIHSDGKITLDVPDDLLLITASHGPEYEIGKVYMDRKKDHSDTIMITIKKLKLPSDFGIWWSGDLHVHMNYAGHYLATPKVLVQQGEAENLNFIYDLIVNKEQRVPDISYFSPDADPESKSDLLLFHSQEYHTSYWGHLGLLNPDNHFLMPGYAGYPYTAFGSLFPNNVFIAKNAHQQHALVGYVHPFLASQLYPEQSEDLTNDLPVTAALHMVDYYEVVGFADHIPSADVWYKLLNCGLRISAGGGTDAMTNYASLRGPVGQDRIYITAKGEINKEHIMEQIKEGHSFATNGPIIELRVNSSEPGDVLKLSKAGETISYEAFVRSNVPVDYLDIIWNGQLVRRYSLKGDKKGLDVTGKFKTDGPGWMLVRTYAEKADPDLFDIYPYATTSPVYFELEGKEPISKSAAEYFLVWVDRLERAARDFNGYRDEKEKESIMGDIDKARQFYRGCIEKATIK